MQQKTSADFQRVLRNVIGLHEVIPFLVGRRGAAHRFFMEQSLRSGQYAVLRFAQGPRVLRQEEAGALDCVRSVYFGIGPDIHWQTDR